jgi:hypothetical protein
MEMLLAGVGLVALGLLLVWAGVGYVRGTGIQSTLFGTPAGGIGLGPAMTAIGVILLLTALPSSGGRYIVMALLLAVFFTGTTVGIVILLVKPFFGWPRYGQWPNLMRRTRTQAPQTDRLGKAMGPRER